MSDEQEGWTAAQWKDWGIDRQQTLDAVREKCQQLHVWLEEVERERDYAMWLAVCFHDSWPSQRKW